VALDFAKFFRGPSREERLTKMGVRADIVAAALKMASDARSDPTLAELTTLMPDDESVLVTMEGRSAKYLGLAVLSTRRIAFAAHGYSGAFVAEVALDDVLHVEEPKKGAFTAVTAAATLTVDRTLGTSAEQFAAAVRRQLATDPAAPKPQPNRDPLEVLAELRALRDAGVMTQEQFDAEKAKLVADL
jgi:hypothetical protein